MFYNLFATTKRDKHTDTQTRHKLEATEFHFGGIKIKIKHFFDLYTLIYFSKLPYKETFFIWALPAVFYFGVLPAVFYLGLSSSISFRCPVKGILIFFVHFHHVVPICCLTSSILFGPYQQYFIWALPAVFYLGLTSSMLFEPYQQYFIWALPAVCYLGLTSSMLFGPYQQYVI